MTNSQKQLGCRLGIIVLAVLAVYAGTLGHGFVWDDNSIIVNNPLLEKLGNIPRFFLSEDTIEGSTGYYRPMTYLSFALERAVWGLNPVGYHLTNLVLHLLAALLLYGVVAALFDQKRLAFLTALIFALHPVAAESVNFLSGGRNTLLCACFALLSLLCYLKKRDLSALACFSVAIFSKEFALLLPAVFLFVDLVLRRERLRPGRYLPYLAPIAVYLTLRSFAVEKANFLGAMNLEDTLMAPYLVVRYLWNMLFPWRLKVLYSVPASVVYGLISLALLAGACAALFYFRKRRELLFAALWSLVFLLPVINIIPLRTTTVMADRYAYFSLMGVSLLLAAVILRRGGRAATLVTLLFCAGFALVDVTHNAAWKNEVAFFTRMTEDAPNRYEGFRNLGLCYYQKGDVERAVFNLAAADSRGETPVKYLVGDAYILWREDRLPQAEKSLLRVVDLNPSNPEPYLILMMISAQKGDGAAARGYREKVQNLAGDVDRILANRTIELCRAGEAFLAKRRFSDAAIYFWQVLRINPQFVPALIDLATLSSQRGDSGGAQQYLYRALAAEPLNAAAHFNLATVYRVQGRAADAEREMARFRELSPLAPTGPGGNAPQ